MVQLKVKRKYSKKQRNRKSSFWLFNRNFKIQLGIYPSEEYQVYKCIKIEDPWDDCDELILQIQCTNNNQQSIEPIGWTRMLEQYSNEK